MLSEQDKKKLASILQTWVASDLLADIPRLVEVVLEVFAPHLQQPFPGNNKIRATSLHQHPLSGDPALGQGLKLEGLNSDQVEGILQFIGAECLGISEALHTGGSEPDCENCDNKGKVICTSNGRPDCRFATHWIPCPQCKPVCATCGGSGRLPCEDCSGRQVHCEHTFTQKPCPACKPEHCPDCDWDVDEVEGSEDMLVKACKKHECQTCGGSGEVAVMFGQLAQTQPCPACKEVRYHRSGQGMHLDERGEQRREKAGVFYKDSNLVWIGHRDGVLGSLYVIDSRVSDRRKGD